MESGPNILINRVRFVCSSLSGKHLEYVGQEFVVGRRRRMWIAFRQIGIFWLAALIFLPVPFIHFFLVPGFLLSGIAAGFMSYRKHGKYLKAMDIVCPTCGVPVHLNERSLRGTFKEMCPSCRHGFVCQRTDAPNS